jgi:hypothetical protein
VLIKWSKVRFRDGIPLELAGDPALVEHQDPVTEPDQLGSSVELNMTMPPLPDISRMSP